MAESVASQEARKTVTVLFADVSGSTGIGERLDPESLRRIMHRYFEELRAVVERHEGTVEKFIGDAVMAVFGIPRVHEDDALRAVRAEELRLRGKTEPSGARRLRAVRPGVPGHVRRLDTPMIGRRRELALREEAYERTARTLACQLVTVLGPAGIGKSRLVREFVLPLREEARVAQGRCLPYGEGITYWPVAER